MPTTWSFPIITKLCGLILLIVAIVLLATGRGALEAVVVFLTGLGLLCV